MGALRVAAPRPLLSAQGAAFASKAILGSLSTSSTACTAGLRSSYYLLRPHHSLLGKRKFSTTPKQHLEVFPPPKDAPSIRVTPAAWQHPVYSEEAMEKIAVARREVKTWSDWTAFNLVRLFRWGTDLATGYRHQKELKKLGNDPNAKRFEMT